MICSLCTGDREIFVLSISLDRSDKAEVSRIMTKEYQVIIEGNIYTITASDEKEVLLEAKAAGKAIVGVWNRNRGQNLDVSAAAYLVESTEDLTEQYLQQIVRRELGLPWIIAETRRLMIREFQIGDEQQIPKEPEDRAEDEIFRSPELLRNYIQYQYGFYEYGIWAIVEKESGRIIGKAGVTNLDWESEDTAADIEKSGVFGRKQDKRQRNYEERKDGIELGYHIFTPYRKKGYGTEACQAILAWCRKQMECPIYAKIDDSNEVSVRLATTLGFQLTDRKYNESGQWHGLYEWSC